VSEVGSKGATEMEAAFVEEKLEGALHFVSGNRPQSIGSDQDSDGSRPSSSTTRFGRSKGSVVARVASLPIS
jgi:hypothetical protein